MLFIDLFAGLGGFHVGLSELDFTCVFASELDVHLAELYKKNFDMPKVFGDIRSVNVDEVPAHDILCAGFPCQPFSKAGSQEGERDEVRGTLFADIVRILDRHKPTYFILENVANLKQHDKGRTWKKIEYILQQKLGYDIDEKILSPHEYGIPQMRQRMFIVGSRDGLNNFAWPQPIHNELRVADIVDDTEIGVKFIPQRESHCLSIWQRFLDVLPIDCKLPSFPIWATEFGATYPFEDKTPWACTASELAASLGSFGQALHGMDKESQIAALPKYAQFKTEQFPTWKKRYIRQNRDFYTKYKSQIDSILPEIIDLPFSWQKFEWNCQGGERNLYKYIIQFRPSGIRVRRADFSPALVASTETQVPIWAWKGRYMTPTEGAKLQSLERIKLPDNRIKAFKALGNAVNADIVKAIAICLTGVVPGPKHTTSQACAGKPSDHFVKQKLSPVELE